MIINESVVGGYNLANAPGVLTLFLINRADVLSVLDPIRHRLPGATPAKVTTGAIVLRTGTKVCRMKFPPLACLYTETAERTDGGNAFAHAIEFSMPRQQEGVLEFFYASPQAQYVAILVDANLQAYVVGNEEQGLRAGQVRNIAATNSVSFSFSAKLNVPAFLLETSASGFVLADQFRDTEFGLDFSLDFNA